MGFLGFLGARVCPLGDPGVILDGPGTLPGDILERFWVTVWVTVCVSCSSTVTKLRPKFAKLCPKFRAVGGPP